MIKTVGGPGVDRFDRYRDAISRQPIPIEIRSERPDTFWSALRAVDLDGVDVATLDSRSTGLFEAIRTPKLVRRSDPESYRLMLNQGGVSELTQYDRPALLKPGDLALCDSSRPFLVRRRNKHKYVMVTFPRARLPLHPTAVRTLIGTRITGQAGITPLVRSMVDQLGRSRPLPSPAACHLASAVVDLVTALVAQELGAGDAIPAESYQRTLLVRAQAFIEQHLDDPDLDPATVAGAHHISVRTLHRLFHPTGRTVAGWIRARRLEHCRLDLANPRLHGQPIHVIAARWGFPTPAQFSRIFRTAHGVSPQTYRHLSHVAPIDNELTRQANDPGAGLRQDRLGTTRDNP